MPNLSPGDLVKWNRNSSDPCDHEVIGMVVVYEEADRILVRWSDGVDSFCGTGDLRALSPCEASVE